MMRRLAFLWLAAVMLAGSYLAFRVQQGLTFDTDLMALLPQEERDPALQRANQAVAASLSRRVVILIGHADRAQARVAAQAMQAGLTRDGLLLPEGGEFGAAQMRRLGALYFPYRAGLLAPADRQSLRDGRGGALAARALAQAYSFAGISSAGLLKTDPFLLLPAFFAGLPIPQSRLTPDDGMLSVRDRGATWIFLSFRVQGSPFALTTQRQVIAAYDRLAAAQLAAHPGLAVLHTGVLFFAASGARQALDETSLIGFASLAGTAVFLLLLFRRAAPLGLSLLVIGTGTLVALSASLAIFGTMHVGALLFGVSLIGVAVDYSLQYCGEIFLGPAGTPRERLRRVLPGISLGTATTVIGYLTLLLAPFPGLRQMAAFSTVGLLAAWATVVLWLPPLDRMTPPRQAAAFLAGADRYLRFWTAGRRRFAAVGFLLLGGVVGLARLHVDDDVRHLQSPAAALMREQGQIQSLAGRLDDNQFFVVQAADDEAALQREEALAGRLHPLVAGGTLAGFQSLADYIPSAARQHENRNLAVDRLYRPLLARQAEQLHLAAPPAGPEAGAPVLTPARAREVAPPPAFLSLLSLTGGGAGEALHIVTLDGVRDRAAVSAASAGLPGVKLVDPVRDYSALMGKYRVRALALLLVSAAFMAPLLLWRYGARAGAKVMAPPALAVALTPGLRALGGGAFTFFDAMGLVLILAVGVDYAVFCAETRGPHRPVTMLAVAMAAGAALLSFGLLALSHVAAVSAFGATMAVGISLSFLFAPLACARFSDPSPFAKAEVLET